MGLARETNRNAARRARGMDAATTLRGELATGDSIFAPDADYWKEIARPSKTRLHLGTGFSGALTRETKA